LFDQLSDDFNEIVNKERTMSIYQTTSTRMIAVLAAGFVVIAATENAAARGGNHMMRPMGAGAGMARANLFQAGSAGTVSMRTQSMRVINTNGSASSKQASAAKQATMQQSQALVQNPQPTTNAGSKQKVAGSVCAESACPIDKPIPFVDPKLLTRAGERIVPAAKWVGHEVKEGAVAFGHDVKEGAVTLGHAAAKAGSAVGHTAYKVGSAVGSAAQTVGQGVSSAAGTVADGAKTAYRGVSKATDAVGSGISKVSGVVGSVVHGIGTAVHYVGKAFSVTTHVASAVSHAANTAAHAVSTVAHSVTSAVGSAAKGAWHAITSIF
jgi:hypothetical protein